MLETMAFAAPTSRAYRRAAIDDAPDGVRGSDARGRGERREVGRLGNDLVSFLSHELRTPLTSIHGSLRLAAAGALGPIPVEAGELIAVAGRNCARLIGLIDDLLDHDRQDDQIPAKPFDPLALAAQVRAALGIV